MKKLAIIALLAVAGAASAADLGLRYGHNAGTRSDATGVTFGTTVGAFGAELSYDRTNGVARNDRYALVGSYPLTKIGAATLSAKAGAAYIRPGVGQSGYAGVVGLGLAYPLTKTVSLTADYGYQSGQSRVNAFNGNLVTVGVKYSF